MQSHHRQSNLSRPSGYPGSSNAGQSSSTSTSFGGQVNDLPSHLPSGEPIPIGDQLMQVDQAITLTLQEIDANFAKTHQIITARILPMIKRYGIASHNTWQGAKFWHKFFEAASDIHLAPPREQSTFDSTAEDEDEEGGRVEKYAEEGEEQSFDRNDQSMQSFQGTRPRSRRAIENDSYDIEDDSGELRHSHFEPPRVSDASVAATARLSRTGLGTSQSGRNFDRTYDQDESAEFDQIGDFDIDPNSLKTAKVGRADTIPKLAKVQATPRRDSAKKNPFAKPARAPQPFQQQQPKEKASTSSVDSDAAAAAKRANSPSKWNGIADLRKTPLSHINRSPIRKGSKASGKSKSSTNIDEDDEDSLAWPAGMSPPVTMQFSVPRSRYNKTPAKEAAKLVVDDLLRTVESTTPAARRRLMQERQTGGKEGQPISVRSRGIERLEGNIASNNLVGTPLGTGKRRPNKGRTSMPTPPTVTKRVGGPIRASTSTQRESTPKSNTSKVPSTASRLMDEDEEGQSLTNEEVPEDLGTGLSKLAINRPGAADGMDKLFEGDEDDSDNDMEDTDSEEEEDEYEGSALSSVRAPGAFPKGNASHTSSSIASVSHSIDEDTLFGIRDPSLGQKSYKSGPSQTPMVSNTSKAGSASSSGQGKTSNPAGSHQSANASLAAATPSTNPYRPMGQVANLGTVYRGRPLLGEERDDTYSAPSPTPAAFSGGRPPGR